MLIEPEYVQHAVAVRGHLLVQKRNDVWCLLTVFLPIPKLFKFTQQ
jgi:hypothetical protein